MYTDGRTDARTDGRTPDRPVYYKLTLWAFGSGELKYRVICNQVMQYAALDKGCLNYVEPEMPDPCINC